MSNNIFSAFEQKGCKRGIFFRNPFSSFDYELYSGYGPQPNFFEKLLNIRRIKHAETNDANEVHLLGCTSPIYFHKVFRHVSYALINNNPVTHVESYGWEKYKNSCSGACEKEITEVWYADGTKQKIVHRDLYHYTYRHIVESEFGKIEA